MGDVRDWGFWGSKHFLLFLVLVFLFNNFERF